MAAGKVMVPCPACDTPVEVPITTTSSSLSNGELLVLMAPSMDRFAEHYAAQHAVLAE